MKFMTAIRDDEYSRQLEQKVRSRLEADGNEYDTEHPEYILCIGGDGTILRAIHEFSDHLDEAAFVGIHTGTLGFLTDYTVQELDELLAVMQTTEPAIEKSVMLEITLPKSNENLYVFNEVRIESLNRTLRASIYIDDEFFEDVQGSGVCICTQQGSTAINRSLNGAVIDPGLKVMELSEIIPISHRNHHSLGNPYILNMDRVITIRGESLLKAYIGYDHLERKLYPNDTVIVRAAKKEVRFARFRKYSFLDRLRNLY